MRRSLLATSFISCLSVVTACGGNSEDPKTAAKASIDLSPMEELKAIPKDLEAEITSLTKPIDDIQSLIDDLTNLPKKYGIAAADMASMAKATFDSGKVSVSLKGDVSAEARAEIEAVLTRLNGAVVALKATPTKVAGLTKQAAAATAKVPLLGAKITASATATVANPFGDAAAKAKAQGELDSVKQVQADVMKSVNDFEHKLTEIPAMATSALAKLTASFATG